MPDILTHTAFADEILKKINSHSLKTEIEKRKALYRLGAQGPDIFFYYRFLSKEKNVNSIGNKLHEEKTGYFLKESFDYINTKELNEEDYYNLLSYVIGFMCHYTLDKNTHPFVYRYCGFSFENGIEKGLYSLNHKEMENMIDVYIWQYKKNTHAYKQPIHKLIKNNRGLPSSIKKYLQETIQKVYDIEITEQEIARSYKDMVTAFKLLYDPYKIKIRILKGLEYIRKKKIILGKPLYSSDIEKTKKYMNLEKKIWTHPLDENKVYDLSFMELYNLSMEECILMLNQILATLGKRETIDVNIFGNKSYLTNFIYDAEPNLIKAEAVGLLEKGGTE